MSAGKVVRLDLVGKSLDDAAAAPELAPGGRPPDDDRSSGGGGGGEGKRRDGLPEDCPVEALGLAGDTYAYLDQLRQYREIRAKDHGRSQLLGLFGERSGWLYETWPRTDKDGTTTGWRPEKCGEALMRACARHGIWDAGDRVRGAGCWRGEEGELIWHCGDVVVVTDRDGQRFEAAPGLVFGGVYPAAGALPRPEISDQAAARAGVEAILADLSTWQWTRGQRDARLLLGWMAAAHIGGALMWRPSCWMTGGAGAGKSSLQAFNRGLFGQSALISAESASPAAIWQTLGRRTLPCAFDETEYDEDNPRRVAGMIELARIAASGGQVRRGGNDHNAVLFVLRSSFMFSSIIIPPMSGADRQRLAILELNPLPKGQAPPDVRPARLRKLGAAMRARLVHGWPRLEGLIEVIRHGLVEREHSARGADQFGVLLACADLVLNDEPPDSDSLDELLDGYALDQLVEVAGDASGPERCLMHLLSSIIDPYSSGGRKNVGEWIEEASRAPNVMDSGYEQAEAARKALATHGMRVMFEGDHPAWLAVANAHQALSVLYQGSRWAGRSGSDGGWPQELRRLEGHYVPPRPVRFAGMVSRAVLVPLGRVRGGDTYEP